MQLVVVALLVSLWFGCGQDNPMGRLAVSGTVKLNGEPVANGNVTFMPMVKSEGLTMAGGTIVNGSYSVATAKGLAPGEYSVTIGIPDPNWTREQGLNPKELAPPDWASGTAHTVTVKAGESNVFDFDLQTQ
jgi:hypothetical protein